MQAATPSAQLDPDFDMIFGDGSYILDIVEQGKGGDLVTEVLGQPSLPQDELANAQPSATDAPPPPLDLNAVFQSSPDFQLLPQLGGGRRRRTQSPAPVSTGTKLRTRVTPTARATHLTMKAVERRALQQPKFDSEPIKDSKPGYAAFGSTDSDNPFTSNASATLPTQYQESRPLSGPGHSDVHSNSGMYHGSDMFGYNAQMLDEFQLDNCSDGGYAQSTGSAYPHQTECYGSDDAFSHQPYRQPNPQAYRLPNAHQHEEHHQPLNSKEHVAMASNHHPDLVLSLPVPSASTGEPSLQRFYQRGEFVEPPGPDRPTTPVRGGGADNNLSPTVAQSSKAQTNAFHDGFEQMDDVLKTPVRSGQVDNKFSPTVAQLSKAQTKALHNGFEQMNKIMKNISTETGLGVDQIVDRWSASVGCQARTTWNIYQSYFRVHEEQELLRVDPQHRPPG